MRIDDLNRGGMVGRRYRNRRIGEFLKELRLTEGRGTGIPAIFRAMRDNGSPEPRFLTDETRSYFATVLPVDPLAGLRADDVGLKDDCVSAIPEVLHTDPRRWDVLYHALEPQSRAALQGRAGVASREHFTRRYLRPLIEAGLLALVDPARPNAPNQRYQATERGRMLAVLHKQRASRGQVEGK